MPLLDLWKSNPAAINEFSIEQVVSSAGDGVLKDGSACSLELRGFLSQVPSAKLAEYTEGCLNTHFPKGGMVLQDLVNELGRRLDYKVANGRYQGVINSIGNDGVWASPEGHSLVVEVKTTDTYRIALDRIAEYREKLSKVGELTPSSSILIIVGREDTGELEAQVRGSRHAWDIRLISTDWLVKLVQLKENAEEIETSRKIRSLLIPKEYTRLDQLIDIMFTTAKDVEGEVADAEDIQEGIASAPQAKPKGTWQFTDSVVLEKKRDAILAALAERENTKFIQKSRALYWDPEHAVRIACTLSKHHIRKGLTPYRYWYAYHPQWDEFLAEGKRSYLVLGCVDLEIAFALPVNVVRSIVDALNTTEKETGEKYWHLYLAGTKPQNIALLLPKRKTELMLSDYVIELR